MDFASARAERRYADLAAAAPSVVIGLDFDGTLAPIVADPTRAHIHPDAAPVLVDLAAEVGGVAIITGRPVRQVLELGNLDDLGARIRAAGGAFDVYGQYGNERWSAGTRRIVSPRPPRGLATFERDLPRALRSAGAEEAYVEDKGLAVAVHTRRLAEPAAAFDRLLPLLRGLADRHGLALELGKSVIEVRDAATHKGSVVDELATARDARGFLYAGDDLGDIEAFEAVEALRERGLATLRVCSLSEEHTALADRADVIVRGPDGVLGLLRQLVDDVRRR
ncbi:trehalose-phosphatase [Nocardioides panacisoli]|uniref:trehalose-phosphatase n=1 Tax=Nocardioides panacisoli TaxID=627624 RepID=UPI001C627C57|nr:trehalose-phosphatase [Nocardioides panacisoli]QYJ04022.1 trehalose-phosphatase [Nocardioides panacisoli]